MDIHIAVDKTTVKQALPWLLCLVMLIVLLWFIFRKVKTPDLPSNDIISRYNQHQTDSLLKVDRARTADSVRYKIIDSINNVTKNTDSKIQKIKSNVEKVVRVYDTLPPAELRRILTNRYR